MKRLLLSCAGALALGFAAQTASAADMPAPVYKAPPPAAALFNWTGFYVGLQAGYGWGDSNINDGGFAPSWSTSGWLAGAFVGFNYQISALVLGVEGDLNFANITGNVDPGPPTNVVSSKIDSLGSIRGRLGFTGGQWLFFATAGYAWAGASHSQTAAFAAVPTGTANATLQGPTAGLGIEFASTPNLLWRIEYRHYWWDTVNLIMPVPYTARAFSNRLDTVTIGLAWKM